VTPSPFLRSPPWPTATTTGVTHAVEATATGIGLGNRAAADLVETSALLQHVVEQFRYRGAAPPPKISAGWSC
jgi:hypothetical protein